MPVRAMRRSHALESPPHAGEPDAHEIYGRPGKQKASSSRVSCHRLLCSAPRLGSSRVATALVPREDGLSRVRSDRSPAAGARHANQQQFRPPHPHRRTPRRVGRGGKEKGLGSGLRRRVRAHECPPFPLLFPGNPAWRLPRREGPPAVPDSRSDPGAAPKPP